MRSLHRSTTLLLCAFAAAAACSSDSNSSAPGAAAGAGGNTAGSGGAPLAGNGGAPTAGSGGLNTGGAPLAGSGGSTPVDSGPAIDTGARPSTASALATALNKPARLLIGLGGGTAPSELNRQKIKIDIYERYLVSLQNPGCTGNCPWPGWNSPAGAYVNVVAADADSVGAVPMYTLYQMATTGDGNIDNVIANSALMTTFWSQTKLMYQRIAIYNKPALVNFEPDFWGYAMLKNQDPTKLKVLVKLNADCASLPDDVTGFGKCLVLMARTYAPTAQVGFPPSDWGFGTDAVIAYIKQAGAGDADFVVMQTLDADAGCFEAKANTKCASRGNGPFYWDETNATSPNFREHLADVAKYSTGIGKPVIWWQTPLGVPSATFGSSKHFRDNRVHYFLTHASELVAAGGLGAVFSPGDGEQTDVTTDNGEFATLSAAYLQNPAALK